MRSAQAATAFTLVSNVAAFWRMPCRSRTGLARMDPLMDPGEVSDHVHTIHGGGNFGFTTTYDDLAHASGDQNCTSCEVVEDMSAYWTPVPYFIHDDGTAELVPQVGGMLAYYLFYLDNVVPFPEGFQMIAGDKHVRNFTGPFPDTELSSWPTDPTNQFFLQQRAIGFNCLNYAIAPEPSLYRHQFPTKDYMDANCKDGIRMELAFPSCSNGELDSADHKSHVAYPSLVKEGNCPSGYDVHLPFMFYETIWATNTFAGKSGKFVMSYGDPIGTGYHGDFIMGWKSADFLGDAIKSCTSESGEISACPMFTIQEDSEAAMCTFPEPEELKSDEAAGPCASGLPVDVPIQYGPEPATAYPVAGRSGTPTSSIAPTLSSVATSFSLPTLSYSAANPSETETAPGGIIVAVATSKSSSQAAPLPATSESAASAYEAPSSTITSAPSVSENSDDGAEVVATSYMTQGHQVVEMVIEEVEVTVTATATPSAGAKHRRHLHKHLHHEGIRR